MPRYLRFGAIVILVIEQSGIHKSFSNTTIVFQMANFFQEITSHEFERALVATDWS